MPTNRLDHAHIFSSDVDATITFFTAMFGARVVWDGEAAGARNVRLDLGGGALHLYDQPPRGTGRPLVHHLGIRTDDLLGLMEEMRTRGYDFDNAVSEYPHFRYVMVAAPDGLLLELFEPKPGGEWLVGGGGADAEA